MCGDECLIKTEYSAEEVGRIIDKLNEDYHAHYVFEGNDDTLHIKGFSNRETKWRLEPYFPVLYECPSKYDIHVTEDGSWIFYRIPSKRTATM